MDAKYNRKIIWISVFVIANLLLFIYLLHPVQWFSARGKEVKLFYVDNISDTHRLLIEKFNREYKGKIKVIAVNLPFEKFTTNERKEMLARSLRSKSERIDVFTVDIIWTPRFAKWGASLQPFYSDADLAEFIPQSLQTCYHNQRLVAVPFYLDVGLLYYQKGLLRQLPDYDALIAKIRKGLSWPEMIAIGQRLKKDDRPIFLFPADNFEGLMCVFYETLSPSDIQTMFSGDSVRLNIPVARRGLQLLYDFIHRYHFTPPQVCNFDEIACYNWMLEKDGLFLRGWPGFWLRVDDYNRTHKIKREIDIAPMPHFKGQNKTVVYGGWNFMVANKSKHKREAIQFIKFFQRPENQKILFTHGGYLPALNLVYRDSRLLKKHPEINVLRKILQNGQFRPMREDYTRISDIMSFYFRKALIGEISVQDALKEAEKAINSQSINLK